MLATRLGIPFRRIRLVQGDSDRADRRRRHRRVEIDDRQRQRDRRRPAEKVIENGKQIAAHVLEAAAADIEFRAGRFVIAGTDRAIGIMELAAKIRDGLELPPELPQSARCRRHL